MSHYFLLLHCPFSEFPKEVCKKPGQKWPLVLCQNICFIACSKIFSKGLGVFAVRAPTESQTRLAWRRKVSFLKKKVCFYDSTLLRQYFIELWKNRSKCGKRGMAFAGCLEKSFPKSQVFQRISASSFFPSMCINLFEKEVQPVASTHYNCNTMPHGEPPFRLTTFNILTLNIFPLNFHRGKTRGKNKAINLPTKAIQMSLP